MKKFLTLGLMILGIFLGILFLFHFLPQAKGHEIEFRTYSYGYCEPLSSFDSELGTDSPVIVERPRVFKRAWVTRRYYSDWGDFSYRPYPYYRYYNPGFKHYEFRSFRPYRHYNYYHYRPRHSRVIIGW